MRNEEKHALRRELRRARAQMGHQGRLAAGQTVNRLLKRYIKKGRKIGVYWPMGKELRLDGFVRAAQKRGADLLVLGTHGRTGLMHLLMGSFAETVMRQSHLPLLIIRSKAEEA